jgi:hypothetical protein
MIEDQMVQCENGGQQGKKMQEKQAVTCFNQNRMFFIVPNCDQVDHQ